MLFVVLLPVLFHEQARSYLETRGIHDWPVVDRTMPAIVLAGGYLYWRLLRHAVLFEYGTRPGVTAHILDPGQRYETYVALGNRVLRLYHLEVANPSNVRTARGVFVMLTNYQQAGDSRKVDIRSRLKVANSDAEVLDLNPGARVAFESCGIEVPSAGRAAIEDRAEQNFSILPAGSGTIRVVVQAQDAPAREEPCTACTLTPRAP